MESEPIEEFDPGVVAAKDAEAIDNSEIGHALEHSRIVKAAIYAGTVISVAAGFYVAYKTGGLPTSGPAP